MADTKRPDPADTDADETPADDRQEPSAGPGLTEPGPTEQESDGDLAKSDTESPDVDLTFPAATSNPWPALLGAEAFGTFVLVLAGVGTALYASLGLNGGPLAVPLAFGLALAAGVAAFGNVSGAHFNPAVTLGAALAGRLDWVRVLPYIVAQLVGGILAALLLFVTVPAKLPTALDGPEANVRQFFSGTANGFDGTVDPTTLDGANTPLAHASSGQVTVSWLTALTIEAVVTAAFVGVILAVTRRQASRAAAPLAIGGALTVGLLVAMTLTNGSLNPARSTAVVLFSDTWAATQLWVFWVGPLLGAAIAGLAARLFAPLELETQDETSDEPVASSV